MNTRQVQNLAKKLKRPKKSHKGDYGRIFILAGSKGMAGAANLCGRASLRSGAGLVSIGVPESIYKVVSRKDFEVMVKPLPETKTGTLAYKAYCPVLKALANQNVLALGPGLSQDPSTQKLVRRLLRGFEGPAVLDADGLNAVAGFCNILKERKGATVLTPHEGEFMRLLGTQKKQVNAETRKREALKYSKKFNSVIVLKGHRTVVAAPDGKVYVNQTGNPGMATAGSGDVLTGMIAALIGQKLSVFESACLSVYLHGKAGDLAVKKTGQVSLIASDLIGNISKAIQVTMK